VNRVIALARMRVLAYWRSQRAVGPLLLTLVLLGTAYAGGPSEPAQAYGFSAALLLGVYAWQAKLLLDVEPDEQRSIARAAVGRARREVVAGALAALVASVPLVVLAGIVPALLGALLPSLGLGGALAFGLVLHALTAACGVGFGVLASRTVVRSNGWGVVILVGVSALVLILGTRTGSGVQWLVPPVLAAARVEGIGGLTLVSLGLLAWAAALFLAYAALRRTRP
jgi:hypothetical protein